MKKYSSYKSIKPLNTTFNNVPKQPQTPSHSKSYRKLTILEQSNQRLPQKSQIYPISAKYSSCVTNLTATNGNRKKMFSGKSPLQNQNALRPLTLSKQQLVYSPTPQQSNSQQLNSTNQGYGNIRSKIDDLQSKLNEIKKNYEISYHNRTKGTANQNQKSFKDLIKKEDKFINKKTLSIQNKENQIPTEKKTSSKLLLERYQNNKKLKSNNSISTANLLRYQTKTQENSSYQYPLSPKNIIFSKINSPPVTTSKKTQNLVFTQNNLIKNTPIESCSFNSPKNQNHNKVSKNHQTAYSNQQQDYLKQFVTAFPCQNKLPLSHSTSETNLFKPHNKLGAGKNDLEMNQYYISAILKAFESRSPNSFQNLCKNHIITSLDILTYVKNVNKLPPQQYECRRLPPVKDNKKTIVFDLDQTLIHCNQNITMPYDVALPIKFPNGALLKAGINIRPFAQQCLKQLSKYFELIVFTASHECYGNVIVDYLDPKKEYITARYFRDSCFKTEEGFYVKDLRVIDRDLSKLLLIDNAAYSYCFQLQNGVPIIPFYDNKADLQLKCLIKYLKGFLSLQDVRCKNSGEFKLSDYTKFKDVKSLVNKLYGQSD